VTTFFGALFLAGAASSGAAWNIGTGIAALARDVAFTSTASFASGALTSSSLALSFFALLVLFLIARFRDFFGSIAIIQILIWVRGQVVLDLRYYSRLQLRSNSEKSSEN
jgi:hypothetical protein